MWLTCRMKTVFLRKQDGQSNYKSSPSTSSSSSLFALNYKHKRPQMFPLMQANQIFGELVTVVLNLHPLLPPPPPPHLSLNCLASFPGLGTRLWTVKRKGLKCFPFMQANPVFGDLVTVVLTNKISTPFIFLLLLTFCQCPTSLRVQCQSQPPGSDPTLPVRSDSPLAHCMEATASLYPAKGMRLANSQNIGSC